MGNPKPVPAEKGNQRAFKHGGAAAERAIQRGEPLTGPARQVELAVYEELETQGRYHLVRRNAARLQAACDLYWGAISNLMQDVSERGSLPTDIVIVKLDKYVKRFGWLAGASLRAWAQVREEEREAAEAMVTDYEELLSEDD